MTQDRRTLSLRLGGGNEEPTADPFQVLLHAIEHQLCIRATYNRAQVILGPHILYDRHGDPHVDGVVIERDGARPAEQKIGTFKLNGLRNPVGTMEPMRIFPGFSRHDPRYIEKVHAAITD